MYGERLLRDGSVEYRQWDPWRSKLAAYLLRVPPNRWGPAPNRILYLGGAHGTTVSHLADVARDGETFVVEKSPMAFVALLALAEQRTNLYPLLADAQLPERYRASVGTVEFLYQDVAQRAQARIFAENAEACLAPGGRGLLMLKVRSVTQRQSTRTVVSAARTELERRGLTSEAPVDLAPFARDHVALRLAY